MEPTTAATLPQSNTARIMHDIVNNPRVVMLCTVPDDPHCDRARAEAAAVQAMLAPFTIFEVDLRQSPMLGARYGIESVPTYLVWQDRTLVRRNAGALAGAELVQWLGEVDRG